MKLINVYNKIFILYLSILVISAFYVIYTNWKVSGKIDPTPILTNFQ